MKRALRWLWLGGCWTAGYLLLAEHPAAWDWRVRTALAVVLMAGGIWWWGADAPGKNQETLRVRRRAGARDYLGLAGLLLAVAGISVAFFTAAPRMLEQAGMALEEWAQPKAALERKLEQGVTSSSGAGMWIVDGEGRRPLPRRGDFKPGNRPEVYLKTPDPVQAEEMMKHRLYVRAFSLGRYERGSWSPADEGDEILLESDQDGWVDLEERSGEAWRYEVIHGSTLSPRQPLLGLQGLRRVQHKGLRKAGESFVWLPEDGEKKGYHYTAESVVKMLDDLAVSAVSGGEASAAYLQMPEEEGMERVRNLAAETVRGAKGTVEALYRIRARLQNQYAYSLTIENPGDRDPLMNFLFEEKRGHCELFATAGVLMARAAGVPARMTYGWSGGTFFESGQMFVFRAKESHAWAEVWIDEVGWTILETTPPVAFESDRVEVALPDVPVPVERPKTSGDGEGPMAGAEAGMTAGQAIALAAGMTVMGLLLSGWTRFRGRRSGGAAGGWSESGGEEGGYWQEFRGGLRRQGIRVVRSMTPRQQVKSAESEELQGLDRYHYGVHYLEKERDREEERSWLRKIRRWKSGKGGEGG